MSEESMVEKVARAMCEAAEEDWEASSYLDTASGNEPEEQRDYWRVMARAAIEAMREPTRDMMYRGGGRTAGNMSLAANAYREMIDTALKEPA